MQDYKTFVENKRHTQVNYGIETNYIPDYLFDFQKYVLEYAVKKGRAAIFLDTGLGKTIIELATAVNYIKKFNQKVLIITPLAIAFQFLSEAEKFGIDDIEYSRNGKHTKKIVICNYEMLEHFNPDDFKVVITDESSILKNFDGAYKHRITSFMKKVDYRYLFTATPSPNDFIELGTSSEALGYLGHMDMLTKYFRNNEDTISPHSIGTQWILKSHAKRAFFEWVSSWSISMRKPSDLGFSDEKFILPKLITNHHVVKNTENIMDGDQHTIFNKIARRMTEVRQEQRLTTENRVIKAIEFSQDYETCVYWVNFNYEGDLLDKQISEAYQLKGSMPLEKKEEILLAFSKGEIKKLITKPKITAFGLNWQHCNKTVYFPTWSYEQYYQAIRRFWRFGQKNQVTVDLVYSDGQKRVIDALIAKAEKANELFTSLNANINRDYSINKKELSNQINLPKFLGA